MYRFLLSRRWLSYLLIAVIFALACVFLSRWQMERRNEAQAEIQRVTANYDAAPVPFEEVRSQFEALDPAKQWTQVSLRGSYDVEGLRIVRNRPLNGQPGYEVVVPFRLTSGETVVVDRGWLPIGNAEPGRPDSVPAPPAGVVDVVVRLKPGEPGLDRGAPEGQLASIELPAYADELDYPILEGAYGVLASETPSPAVKPAALTKPTVNEGMHLSYALQWAVFGLLMFVAFGYAARQQARNDADDAAAEARERGEPAPQRTTTAPQRRRGPSAEEEEDAILDAQGF